MSSDAPKKCLPTPTNLVIPSRCCKRKQKSGWHTRREAVRFFPPIVSSWQQPASHPTMVETAPIYKHCIMNGRISWVTLDAHFSFVRLFYYCFHTLCVWDFLKKFARVVCAETFGPDTSRARTSTDRVNEQIITNRCARDRLKWCLMVAQNKIRKFGL